MEYSPMMSHYIELKEKYSDCIIFYRLGDFYEMFFDDAVKASKILDLVLTGRDCGNNQKAPMCGVPYHAVDFYISKLVEAGEKVAICEQLEDPKPGKLVQRDIVRIVTAGTVTDDETLDGTKNNYICSVYVSKSSCAYAWCDITTGEFYTKTCKTDDKINELMDDLTRTAPAEIIGNSAAYDTCNNLPVVLHGILPKFNMYSDYAFNTISAEKILKEHFSVSSLSLFGIDEYPEMISACGALIAYLKETQKHALININKIKIEERNDHLILDSNTIRNLEILRGSRDGKKYGSLLWLLDKTNTVMGARTLAKEIVSPLKSIDDINYRLDGVEELFSNPVLRGGIEEQLDSIRDIERISGKISNGNIMPKDCIELAKSLGVIPNLKMILFGVKSKILSDINDNIADFSEIYKLLTSAIKTEPPATLKDGGYINPQFNEELDRLIKIKKNSSNAITDLESKERENTGIKTLKIRHNKVFGYYIEVTNSFKDQVPYNYIRKQTLVGGERFITEELKKIEEDILTCEERSLKLEEEIYDRIKKILSDNIPLLQQASTAIGYLDMLSSFAFVSKKYNYTRPEIVESGLPLNIVGGRHPVIEAVSKEQFIANETLLDNHENRLMIITGPNMAGKSTYMRQTALITMMAHIGCFIPAKSAEIPITDRIFTRVGASDNLIFDQSTFMVEMTEVASIIMNATKDSLLILDEVGRGTSTYDGLSIAWSVVEYLANNVKAKTLFATHYHELSELEGVIDGVKNYKVTVKEINGSIVFLRRIMRGSANRSFGIEVAAIAGIPNDVTARAKKILKKLEKNDLAKQYNAGESTEEIEEDYSEEQVYHISEVEEIISKTDINTLTPIDALKLLAELKGKVNN